MRRIIIFLLIASIFAVVECKSIFNEVIPSNISLQYNAISVEDGVKFYLLETECYNEYLYTRIKNTYTDSTTWKEHEYRINYTYKYLTGRARWQKNTMVDLNIYQIDLRGLWKGWSAGCLESWDTAPTTYFIFGKQFKFNFDFFIIPGHLEITSDFMTHDFKIWNYENTMNLKFRTEIKAIENVINLLAKKDASLPAVYFKCSYRLKDYGKTISEMLFGFEIEL